MAFREGDRAVATRAGALWGLQKPLFNRDNPRAELRAGDYALWLNGGPRRSGLLPVLPPRADKFALAVRAAPGAPALAGFVDGEEEIPPPDPYVPPPDNCAGWHDLCMTSPCNAWLRESYNVHFNGLNGDDGGGLNGVCRVTYESDCYWRGRSGAWMVTLAHPWVGAGIEWMIEAYQENTGASLAAVVFDAYKPEPEGQEFLLLGLSGAISHYGDVPAATVSL